MLRFLTFLVLLAGAPAWSEVTAPGVTTAQLDAAVASVTANLPESDPQRAELLASYADTRSALSNYATFSQQLENYSQARANAMQEAEAIKRQLVLDHQSPQDSEVTLQDVSLPELEQIIQVDRSELEANKKNLTDIRAAIDALSVRPVEVRSRVTELASLAAQLESQISALADSAPGNSADQAALWRSTAQFASVSMEKAALEEELLSQPMRLELLKAQLDRTSYTVAQLEKRARLLNQRASKLREGEAMRAQASADLALASTQGKHPLLRRLADDNAALTKTFSARNRDIESAETQDGEIRGAAEQLEMDLTSIEHKLELLGMSTVVGDILRERQAQLPAHGELAQQISDNADSIRASSLRQVELEDERRLLRNPGQYVFELLDGLAPEVAEEMKADVIELVHSRRELVRKATDLENTYAHALGDLDFALRRYVLAVDAYRDFISARLLWIPSRDRFGLFYGEIGELEKQLDELFVPSRWMRVLQGLPSHLLAQPVIGVFLMLVAGLVYAGPRLRHQLMVTGKQVGYVRSDSFVSTLQALGLTALLSVKWPLLMLTVAWLFEVRTEESELATALYLSLLRTAPYFWGLEFLRIALLPKGLVDVHFRWPANLVSSLHRQVGTLEMTLLPGAVMVVFFLSLYPRSVGGFLGTLAVVLVLCSIAYFFHRLPEFVHSKMQTIFRDKASVENPFWARLLRSLLIWIPVGAVLAVFLGYTFTAIEVALLLVRTFVLLSCILIVHEIGSRWLGLTRRKMAYEVKQELVRSSGEDVEPNIENEILENDPDLLNDEGTKLLNLLTLFAGLLGVAWIWAEVFPALNILDSFSLWHQTITVDGRDITDPVTLLEVLKALIFTAMGIVALRRIPGLFEIFLRQKMQVSAASAYALTRVFQYSATMLLVIVVVGSLGVSWSSLQWAVAALSLGIGFGLQEIVANFISGLIILFEQPIRLGDTVTVGDVSGTVTRIQMRATTIRDYDRRELLVPNKEFITSRLLNWSLSDSVTRRIIQVGVAYGTDMDEAMDIVRDVARRHPLVMANPEATITFDEFGDNSLLICLRYYIEQLDKRLAVDSELRLQINRRFNEAGISIAFPQRDLHIDTTEPLEIRMLKPDHGD
ncbi:MAG: mechanosensitive ion channel [Halioglobus sp.]|nr:mechanosensitive ion channel [Halioglobus sp.]